MNVAERTIEPVSSSDTGSAEYGEIPGERDLTPDQIVAELDRYVIAQSDAKRAVAIALRNRWRRLHVPPPMRDEITPKNIIMIGPTGVGKTEISRRLAKLARAPFVKVEASKFTEVGYVGRDVESIVRDLMEVSFNLIRNEEQRKVIDKARAVAEEKLLDLLLPSSADPNSEERRAEKFAASEGAHNSLANGSAKQGDVHAAETHDASGGSTRSKLREMLRSGKLDERLVEIETQRPVTTHLEIVGPPGFAEVEGQLKEMFSNIMPRPKEKKQLSVADARKVLIAEAQEGLVDQEYIIREAVRRAEEGGIVFIDEIDKICGTDAPGKGPDVSREGVQRDLLPLVEGCTVSTKYGPVRTDHVLFIASGAFHKTKPSDLMPEFQGRFPIRVELQSLTASQFVQILTEPQNALVKQYTALLRTEGVELEFSADGIEEIARLTAEVNSRMENIGARRLHTLLERVLEEVSFVAHTMKGGAVKIDSAYVEKRLSDVVSDVDLSRFIL